MEKAKKADVLLEKSECTTPRNGVVDLPCQNTHKIFMHFSLAKGFCLCYHNLSNLEEDFEMPRELAILACTECKRRNYTTTRNKRTQTNRVEMKKYCPTERKRTLHKEVK